MAEDNEAEKEVKLYEIGLAGVLKYLDVGLLVCLFITGTNRVDIFHIVLLIYLTLFVVYPKFMRRNFVYLVSFVMIIVGIKYIYVLVGYNVNNNPSLYKILFVLGLTNDFEESQKYWRSALINDNWLVVLLAVIQYQLYKSKLLGWIFLETSKTDDGLNDHQFKKNTAEYQKFYELNK